MAVTRAMNRFERREKAERAIYEALGENYTRRRREDIAEDIALTLSIRRVLAGTQQQPPRKIAPDRVGTDEGGQWKIWKTSTHTVAAKLGEHGGIALDRHAAPGPMTPAQAHELSRVLATAAESQPNLKKPE